MAHRPKKKSEFFNKGRCIASPSTADESSPSSVGTTTSDATHNHETIGDLEHHYHDASSCSKSSSGHPFKGETVVQPKCSQGTDDHDGNRRNATVFKDCVSQSEKARVCVPETELTHHEIDNLDHRSSNNSVPNSHSQNVPACKNSDSWQPPQNASKNGYARNHVNGFSHRDLSLSPDSDEIEIIEEHVNNHYNPRKRKTRPEFYDRHHIRGAVVNYPSRPHRYDEGEAIREPRHGGTAYHHSAYPHSSNGYPRYTEPRTSGSYNAERSVLYTTVYEEHHTSVLNGSYPDHGTAAYKVVASRYPDEPLPYSSAVHCRAPPPSLYPAEMSNGRYSENSSNMSNVHNPPYLTSRPSISNHRSTVRMDDLENPGHNLRSGDNASYLVAVRDPRPPELGPRKPFSSSGLGYSSAVNLPPAAGFNSSFDSLPSRKSAFVPVAQNAARMGVNVQHQPLEVPVKPNPRAVVAPPIPVSVSSESTAPQPREPCVEVRPEAPQPPADKKRFQTCRLCHNHGIITPIRGHKYVCPYNKCTCKNCKVTLKRRHFVKEQLKITRRQNSSLQNGKDSHEPAVAHSINLQEVKIKPFPQKDVMMKDLALFDDSDLFQEIDSICRPQGRDKTS